jgi:transaldolase
MKIFLDTIDLKEIKYYLSHANIHGITTNPTLAKRFNMSDDIEMIKKIHNVLDKNSEIHVEAFGETPREIIDNAERIIKKTKIKNLVFKIPFSKSGINAAKILLKNQQKTNLHLIYSLPQALLAASIGSTYICPLIGRLDDIGHDALKNVLNIKNSYKENNYSTMIMASSIRTVYHVIKCFQMGLDAITIPLNVFQQMYDHPLTESGFEIFKKDLTQNLNISTLKINRNLKIDAEDTIGKTLSVLATNKGGAVAICRKNKLSGIFTTGDLNRLINSGRKFHLNDKIGNFMTKKPYTIDVSEKISVAAELIKKLNLGQFVIVDGSTVLGILDAKDVV